MRSFSSRGSIFSGSLGGTRSVDLDISGPELAPLFDLALEAFTKARQALPGSQIRPSPSSLSMGQPLVELRPNWERAAELGVGGSELGYMVWAFTDGAYVDDFYLADQKIDMFLHSTEGKVEHPTDIREIPIYTPLGGVVPLGAVMQATEVVNTETIRRVNGERTVTLSIVSPPSVPLEAAVEIVGREVIDVLHGEGKVPADVKIRIAGANDKLLATRAALSDNLALAIALSYLLMAAVFRHWGYPLLILLTIPVGIAGGIFGLWLMNLLPGVNQRFDIITMLGFLVLIGLVVNNPILLVEQARINMRGGMAALDAVVESTRLRIRPIMMTTLTTVFGLSPLVFVPRVGTELYRGLGIIVLFGLLFSTLITLTFMPSLLALTFQATEKFRAWRRPAAPASA